MRWLFRVLLVSSIALNFNGLLLVGQIHALEFQRGLQVSYKRAQSPLISGCALDFQCGALSFDGQINGQIGRVARQLPYSKANLVIVSSHYSMSFYYQAYGLNFISQIEIPELDACAPDAAPDAQIVFCEHPIPIADDGFAIDEDGAVRLHFSIVGSFRISGGNLIEVEPLPTVDKDTLRLPLLGAAMAVLLQQRGLFSLHASAVAIDGRAAIFIGDKGQGKSTMSSMLYGRGHEIIADDIAVIDDHTTALKSAASTCKLQNLLVRPGFPQFKLVPDALKASFDLESDEMPSVSPLVDKRAVRLNERFLQMPAPLARVYILMDGEWKLEALPPQEALRHLITHSYSARFGRQLLAGAAGARHLQMCGQLINADVVRCLQRPRDLSFLKEVAARVEADMRSVQI